MAHPIGKRITGKFTRGEAVRLSVNGATVDAFRGETVAAALLASGHLRLRTSPGGGSRGAFCHMGVCQECTVEVEGMAVSACQTTCRDGMQITLRHFTDDTH